MVLDDAAIDHLVGSIGLCGDERRIFAAWLQAHPEHIDDSVTAEKLDLLAADAHDVTAMPDILLR